MYQLLTSVCARQEFSLLSKEDEVLENDKQMINPRLYPLSYEGIACLFSMTLYDKKDVKLDMLPMAKDYIGISMNLILRPTEMINHVDKGIFVLLYFSDNINAAINMNDIDKEIRGPLGLESKFPVSRILQIISSVASICPDPSIRFFSYQLLQKFLDFSDDETCGFFLQELLDRCPFPSMRTAAIGLLKDQIDQSFNANCNNRQLFKSPLVVQVFVPIIFKINSIWLTRPSEFWNDYGHIMQALNLYYYLLLKDEQNNWTTVWIPQNIDQMKKKYLNPIKNCLNDIALIPTDDENSAFYTMQIEIMKDLLHKIDQKINYMSAELAVVYAALILEDDNIEITADKLQTLVAAAGIEVEPIWFSLYAKALEGQDLKALLLNVGAPGAGAAAPAGAAGAAAASDAPAEEAKEEEKEESDDDMGFGLFD
ncbi:hypothetical protein G6F58_007891 [Rhizopus delemar]|nr:hypothetical protein G6F58_007891 [Rhizopus delemar]